MIDEPYKVLLQAISDYPPQVIDFFKRMDKLDVCAIIYWLFPEYLDKLQLSDDELELVKMRLRDMRKKGFKKFKICRENDKITINM